MRNDCSFREGEGNWRGNGLFDVLGARITNMRVGGPAWRTDCLVSLGVCRTTKRKQKKIMRIVSLGADGRKTAKVRQLSEESG